MINGRLVQIEREEEVERGKEGKREERAYPVKPVAP